MFFFLNYKADESRGSGLPIRTDIDFPMVEADESILGRIQVSGNGALRSMENAEIVFHERNVRFDYYDRYKGVRIVSAEFLDLLDGLNCQFDAVRLKASVRVGGKITAAISHKNFYLLVIWPRIHCMDLQKSDYCVDRGTQGDVIFLDDEAKNPKTKRIYRLMVDPARAHGLDLFQPEELRSRILVSEEFFIKAIRRGLAGLGFTPSFEADLLDINNLREQDRKIDRV